MKKIHKGFFQTSLRSLRMADNILHAKHEERGFLFSMGKGRDEMWSHFLKTRETDCKRATLPGTGIESTLGMPRKGDQ